MLPNSREREGIARCVKYTKDVGSYTRNTTPYNANLAQELVINKLEEKSLILFKWFNKNYMKVNRDKCHLLMSGNKRTITIIGNT